MGLSHNLIDVIPLLPSSLLSLDLSHNLVSEVSFPRGQSQLQHLDLSHNPLQTLEAESLSGLPRLLSLRLASTQLSTVPGLSSLPRLQSLDLSGLRVTSLGPADLALPGLTSLSLTHCSGLETIEAGVFGDSHHLEILNISHNPGRSHRPTLHYNKFSQSSAGLPPLCWLARPGSLCWTCGTARSPWSPRPRCPRSPRCW